jgi:hypothetical protein
MMELDERMKKKNLQKPWSKRRPLQDWEKGNWDYGMGLDSDIRNIGATYHY